MGQIIRELRKKCGYTQEELAERLGVTYQAISKWENDGGLPDISQVVPLASVFGVSTDVLFGMSETTENDEAWSIIREADHVAQYHDLASHLKAYDILLEGLKKFPTNLILMVRCMHQGVALSLPENGWIYANKRAKEIAKETIRQAKFIIANSQNIQEMLRARQNLVFLYCSQKEFDLASTEAGKFPFQPNFTRYYNMAIVNESMNNNAQTVTCLASETDYMLQGLEDNIARMGKAYYRDGKYHEAISVYEIYFAIMKAIFKDKRPLPYHDFDSGDCYILLAEAYLALGDTAKAMDAVENAVMYYVDLYQSTNEDTIKPHDGIQSPLLRDSELFTRLPKSIIPSKVKNKLTESGIQALKQEKRFIALLDTVNSLS